jgi:hypothetical protein
MNMVFPKYRSAIFLVAVSSIRLENFQAGAAKSFRFQSHGKKFRISEHHLGFPRKDISYLKAFRVRVIT